MLGSGAKSENRISVTKTKFIVRMVKSINKQVPTDLFRPYFIFFFETFNRNCMYIKQNTKQKKTKAKF